MKIRFLCLIQMGKISTTKSFDVMNIYNVYLEKGFPGSEATHSSVLAWRIPGMGEPGGLPSMGSHRVGHD